MQCTKKGKIIINAFQQYYHNQTITHYLLRRFKSWYAFVDFLINLMLISSDLGITDFTTNNRHSSSFCVRGRLLSVIGSITNSPFKTLANLGQVEFTKCLGRGSRIRTYGEWVRAICLNHLAIPLRASVANE